MGERRGEEREGEGEGKGRGEERLAPQRQKLVEENTLKPQSKRAGRGWVCCTVPYHRGTRLGARSRWRHPLSSLRLPCAWPAPRLLLLTTRRPPSGKTDMTQSTASYCSIVETW